jgi:hypothetical protein
MSSVRKSAQLSGRLLKLAFTRPAKLKHVLGTALFATDEVATPATDLTRLPTVSPESLLPDGEALPRLTLALFNRTHASLSVLEWITLILLLRKTRAQSVFEFGTYKGVSITQLALNLPADAVIRTLDLPEQDTALQFAIPDPDELQIAREAGKGSLVPPELRPRIQFLKQDSAKFDERPFAGQVDFVFVDGAHSYDYVKSDSEKGWRMLRPGGIIAWHDCRVADPDVVRFLLESPFQPKRISGTSLAFAVKP